MAHFQLTDEDTRVLLETLQIYLTELRREVAGTEDPEFRRALQKRLSVLERITKGLMARNAQERTVPASGAA